MKPTVEQVGNLLALKRHEGPGEGYWQDFLCEFHQNQREQAVKRSGWMSLVGRAYDWFAEAGPSKWAYGAGLAYAAITAAMILNPPPVENESAPVVPVNYQVVPAPLPPPLEQLDELDLSPSTQGSVGEQMF